MLNNNKKEEHLFNSLNHIQEKFNEHSIKDKWYSIVNDELYNDKNNIIQIEKFHNKNKNNLKYNNILVCGHPYRKKEEINKLNNFIHLCENINLNPIIISPKSSQSFINSRTLNTPIEIYCKNIVIFNKSILNRNIKIPTLKKSKLHDFLENNLIKIIMKFGENLINNISIIELNEHNIKKIIQYYKFLFVKYNIKYVSVFNKIDIYNIIPYYLAYIFDCKIILSDFNPLGDYYFEKSSLFNSSIVNFNSNINLSVKENIIFEKIYKNFIINETSVRRQIKTYKKLEENNYCIFFLDNINWTQSTNFNLYNSNNDYGLYINQSIIIEKLLNFLKNTNISIFLKFHPASTIIDKQKIFKNVNFEFKFNNRLRVIDSCYDTRELINKAKMIILQNTKIVYDCIVKKEYLNKTIVLANNSLTRFLPKLKPNNYSELNNQIKLILNNNRNIEYDSKNIIKHIYKNSKNINIINNSKIENFKEFLFPKIVVNFDRNRVKSLKYSGINIIVNLILKNLKNLLDFDITKIKENNFQDDTLYFSTYSALQKNTKNCCRVILIHDIIYLYNKYSVEKKKSD